MRPFSMQERKRQEKTAQPTGCAANHLWEEDGGENFTCVMKILQSVGQFSLCIRIAQGIRTYLHKSESVVIYMAAKKFSMEIFSCLQATIALRIQG